MPIDINLLRESKGGNPQLVRDSEIKRCRDGSTVDLTIQHYDSWREATYEMESLKAQFNKLSQDIAARKKKDSKDKCEDLIVNISEKKTKIAEAEAKVNTLHGLLTKSLNNIGNILDPSVHISDNEDENVVIKTWGHINLQTADGTPGRLRHHEIMQKLGIINLKKGADVAGHRAYYLKGYGVMLNQALIAYGLNTLQELHYELVQPPFFLRREVMHEAAELTDFEESLYMIPTKSSEGGRDDLFLIATAEQPLAALHRKEVLERSQLPIKYGGVSTCFRREAGAHGKDMWGIFRTHQFEKLEQFIFCAPEDSSKIHQEMIDASCKFFENLNLPYRVVSIVSGALNNAAAIKYDLEAWFPGYGTYRELVSCSNCTNYQSRALNIRLGYPQMGSLEKSFVHTLNGTLCATERTLCCILENYQEIDGVRIPEVLQPYLGGKTFLPYVNDLKK